MTNLLSPPVLAFALGVVAATLRSDLRVPDAMMRALSIYLLLAIGLKGGVALRGETAGAVIGPVVAALVLGVIIPAAAYGTLRMLTRLGRVDRRAIAAHYGSTSLVTFTAALVFLQSAAIPVHRVDAPGHHPAGRRCPSASILSRRSLSGAAIG